MWTHSDALYLTAPQGHSRATGYCFLSSNPATPPTTNDNAPPDNGPVHVLCQIMRQVVASAAEAKLGALFLNAQAMCPLRTALDELGHPQPATPIQTDNITACGILNDTIKQKRSKAIDMQFYWLRDRARQGQFHIFWPPGITNHADYFMKHHPVSHHQTMQPTYLHMPALLANYYACLVGTNQNHLGEGVLIPHSPRSCGHHKNQVRRDSPVTVMTYNALL